MLGSNLLSRIFARSPIGPIQKHIATAHECAVLMVPFFEAVFIEDWNLASQVQQQIKTLENKADVMKKDIRLSLPSNLFLPVPRVDLLEIVRLQDKIANRSKDIAGLVLGRKMEIPKSMQDHFLKYVQRSVATSAQALCAINELDELLETGFQGREVAFVHRLILELDSIETQTDQDQVVIRSMLFDLEKVMDPVHVIFLYKVIDGVGDLADRASRVGSQLQLLLTN